MALPAGWDSGSITTSSRSMSSAARSDEVIRVEELLKQQLSQPSLSRDFTQDHCITRFFQFIRTFSDSKYQFIYREQLRKNVSLERYLLEIDTNDLISFDEEIARALIDFPSQLLPWFEKAVGEAIAAQEGRTNDPSMTVDPLEGPKQQRLRLQRRAPQVLLTSPSVPISIRDLNSSNVGKLVAVPGIVISASRKHAKAAELQIRCKTCGHLARIPSRPGYLPTPLPSNCLSQQASQLQQQALPGSTKCPSNPYTILGDGSVFIDQQSLKLQEAPEDIPTGEMPRHLMLSVEKEQLVSIATPGTRLIAVGIYSISGGSSEKGGEAATIRNPFLQVVGMQIVDSSSSPSSAGRGFSSFSRDEDQMFMALSRSPDIYSLLCKSVAPAIFGHEDIKKALVCLLMSGSKKILPDGMRLRGDINILLLGDPGTAKSQFLKFIEKVAPIGVYTSGKGSSAAGLTASVVRDSHSREFYLEGGAMVLADGGVVCIDEFDKMHTRDRVAIHEAMEQQTISIAKAGITTILNSRTSVLAAANPIFGSFDDSKSPFENIEFQSTILSRFDMIFFVRDHRSESKDKSIAEHIMNIHISGNSQQAEEGLLDMATMRRYISFCRSKCAPRLSSSAAEVLKNHYVSIRSSVRERPNEKSAIPITVRQLEAIIRITESLAKLSLSTVATEKHVTEAIRLFKVSTLEAASAGFSGAETLSPELMAEVNTAEIIIRRRLPVGAKTSVARLIGDIQAQKLSKQATQRAIQILVQRGELNYVNQRKMLSRVR